MKNVKYSLFSFVTLVALLFAACKKEPFDADFDLPRQFKPGNINIAAGEIQARLSWSPSLFTTGKGVTYTVQVANDSLFQGNLVFDQTVDTSSVLLTDNELEVGRAYFARVKANANGPTAESGWVVSDSFKITGEQIFTQVLDADLTDSSVVLKWRPSAGLTRITVTPNGGGAAIEVPLTATDVAANEKKVTGLKQLTTYTARVYRNNTQKGIVTFTTKEKSIFTVIIGPSDDLVSAIENAANGDVIGLRPGTYNAFNNTGAFTNMEIVGKTITLQSFSGDPNNTKVNFKELKLKGTGAGITVKGIEFDGSAADADYFLNLTGMNSDGEAATFTNIFVENCIIHNTNNAFLRGNRASANAHKIDTIKVSNSIAYTNGTGSYHYFMIDKLQFRHLEVSTTTFYDVARALISWATNMDVPTTPTILFNYTTINNFGFGGRNNIVLDANANTVNATFKNSIIANTPKPGQSVGSSAMRAGSSSSIQFVHNNYFNLNGGDPSATLSFPSVVQMANNQTIDLGWTATTTNFTLPAGSPLRTASESNGPIGDPRWW